ncbi:MAG TPA: Gfo/Idh/MocA family oxidoreductase [candidate division Zixibacteria bacterium]|nr:Gfo/Idh/MocA family oxidoreductase [candidate division Zixibacteria bacterium]
MVDKVRVGIIGCGDISGAYIEGCRSFEILEIAGCADLYHDKAIEKAAAYGLRKAYHIEEMVADSDIDIVINLTTPNAHAEVSLMALNSGKHIYSEKPLATNRRDGLRILESAKQRELLVGCAPDTFLGGGLQTCRKMIDDGWIGEVVGATAFMVSRGPESWHPNPAFFYKQGAGPLFDMAPYYLTALINLVGPIARISSITRASFPERTATSDARFGEKIEVEVPTFVAGLMNFVDGPVGSIIMSFDIWYSELPRLEIYGSEGTLSVPDPNHFGGTVRLRQAGDGEWAVIQPTHSVNVSRGIGVADMAHAIRGNRPVRASGDMAYHVLEIMRAFEESSDLGEHVLIDSRCGRPEPLPEGLPPGWLDG